MSSPSIEDQIAEMERTMQALEQATRSGLKRCGRCKRLLPVKSHPATKYCAQCKSPAYQKRGAYEAQATCETCGEEFTSHSPTTKRCPACRRAREEARLGRGHSVELVGVRVWDELRHAEAELLGRVLGELVGLLGLDLEVRRTGPGRP